MSNCDSLDERRDRVYQAVSAVRKILSTTRDVVPPEEVGHTYLDKYLLANQLTNVSIGATMNCLTNIGLTTDGVEKINQWVSDQHKSSSLCFSAVENCSFKKKMQYQEDSPIQYVKETQIQSKGNKKTTHKTVNTIVQYLWNFSVCYEFFFYSGTNLNDRVILLSRTCKCEIKTGTNTFPKIQHTVLPKIDVDFTWLFQQLDKQGNLSFTIDRTSEKCNTPRRNQDIEDGFSFFASLSDWSKQVLEYFTKLFSGLDLTSISDKDLFVPVVPLLERVSSTETSEPRDKPALESLSSFTLEMTRDTPLSYAILPLSDMNTFLQEQQRSISRLFFTLAKVFPAPRGRDVKFITTQEANINVIMLHQIKINECWRESVNYIEELLRQQLITAISKEITPNDFVSYMEYHNRNLFRKEFEPQPFCYNVRRPHHYPEGTISLEAKALDDGSENPVYSIVKSSQATYPMRFSLNAGVFVSFSGYHHLHSFVRHQFNGKPGYQHINLNVRNFFHPKDSSIQLVARARQFSNFILLIGRIISRDEFKPKHAIIIQNKEEILIPLLFEAIPTAKEFQDAIESLTPEQRRFAKAFRALQLNSSLFGIAILQIKPQLEALLRLPKESLTKEVQLTQDILELFLKYNIPSDLMTYDGNFDAPVTEKVEKVRLHIRALQKMIKDIKISEMKAQQMRAAYSISPIRDIPGVPTSWNFKDYIPPVTTQSPKHHLTDLLISKAGIIVTEAAGNIRICDTRCDEQSRGYSQHPCYAPPNFRDLSSSSSKRQHQEANIPKNNNNNNTINLPEPPHKTKELHPGSQEQSPQQKQPQKQKLYEELYEDSDLKRGIDYTKIPSELEAKFMRLDPTAPIHPTIISIAKNWTKNFQRSTLSPPVKEKLSKTNIREERKKAFDLLEALTRCGSLSVEEAEMHVVISSTHCFDKSVLDTVIEDNINPIERVERSVLIMASTIHDQSSANVMVKPEQLGRVQHFSPMLF